jgi:tetratricopeptide (TPR) repeat protein
MAERGHAIESGGRSSARIRGLAFALAVAVTAAAAPVRADGVGDVRTGNAAFGDGRYEAAVEAFTRAILAGDLDPASLAVTFNNRGVAYSELGDYDRAIADYGQALTLAPGDATSIRNLRIAHVRRAAAAARLGDRTAAQADYDRAIALEPDHPLAYLRRGQLALERGDRDAAIADLTKAKELDPGNADIAAQLADAERQPPAAAAPPASPPEPPAAAAPPAPPPPPVIAAPAPSLAPEAGPANATTAAPAADDYSIDPPGGRPARPVVSTVIAPAAGGTGQLYRSLQDVNVRQGPGNDEPRIATLGRGATVRVLSERLGWLELQMADGRRGYVYRRWLEPVAAGNPAPP